MAIEKDPDLKKESPDQDGPDGQLARPGRRPGQGRAQPSLGHDLVDRERMALHQLHQSLRRPDGSVRGGGGQDRQRRAGRRSDPADHDRRRRRDQVQRHAGSRRPLHHRGALPRIPTLAYDPNATGGGRGRWVWDQKRPRFIGEEVFAQGHNPDYAYFGGEAVFVGQVQARPAVGLYARMLTEGYRWSGNGAVHFWQTQDVGTGQYDANAPRAVLCRQWDWTFGSGQTVKRTFGIFNDSRFDDPITFTYTLRLNGLPRPLVVSKEYRVPAGQSEKFDVLLEIPRTLKRDEGELTLSLSVKGEEVFKDVKPISVLAPAPAAAGPLAKLTGQELLVFDPQGQTSAFLRAHKVPFTALTGLGDLPKAGKVLVIGKDALTPAQASSSALAAFASSGRTVIVLEQQHPLKYQGVPADIETSSNEGRIAFGEDLNHPALRGLQQKDFFTWGPMRSYIATPTASRGAAASRWCSAMCACKTVPWSRSRRATVCCCCANSPSVPSSTAMPWPSNCCLICSIMVQATRSSIAPSWRPSTALPSCRKSWKPSGSRYARGRAIASAGAGSEDRRHQRDAGEPGNPGEKSGPPPGVQRRGRLPGPAWADPGWTQGLQQGRWFRPHDPALWPGAGHVSAAPASSDRRAGRRRHRALFLQTDFPLAGGFGDKKFTFKDLPTGKHTFAGVPYVVYDFLTSPVPTVIMLGGPGVPNKLPEAVKGIPVNRKADALFFLQAARLDARRGDHEIKEKKQYELCRYVITYADGKTAEVPIFAETDVEDYRQKTPAAIPGAQIAWTRPYEGTETLGRGLLEAMGQPAP